MLDAKFLNFRSDMKIVIAAMALGVKRAMPAASLCIAPVADGGDGTLDILIKSKNGEFRPGSAGIFDCA